MFTLSDKAAEKIKVLLLEEKKGDEYGLRIGVRGGGCSGYSYTMGFDTMAEGDKTYENNGAKVYVDAKSLVFVAGSELEYSEGLQDAGFTVRNPNATGTCGCGSSFST